MRKISLLIVSGLIVATAGCAQPMGSGYPNTAYGYGPTGNGYGGYSSPPPSNGLGQLISAMFDQPSSSGPPNGYYAQPSYYGPPQGYYPPVPPPNYYGPRRW